MVEHFTKRMVLIKLGLLLLLFHVYIINSNAFNR